jgi:hypothetical protein
LVTLVPGSDERTRMNRVLKLGSVAPFVNSLLLTLKQSQPDGEALVAQLAKAPVTELSAVNRLLADAMAGHRSSSAWEAPPLLRALVQITLKLRMGAKVSFDDLDELITAGSADLGSYFPDERSRQATFDAYVAYLGRYSAAIPLDGLRELDEWKTLRSLLAFDTGTPTNHGGGDALGG